MFLDRKHSVCTYIKDSSVTLFQFRIIKQHVHLQHPFLSCDVVPLPFNVLLIVHTYFIVTVSWKCLRFVRIHFFIVLS